MTPEELQAIQTRCEAAWAGPWATQESPSGGVILLRGDESLRRTFRHPQSHLQVVPTEDGEFIAHSRQDIPALLAEVRRLKGLVEAAYREGLEQGHSFSWDESNAKRLLDGGTDDR